MSLIATIAREMPLAWQIVFGVSAFGLVVLALPFIASRVRVKLRAVANVKASGPAEISHSEELGKWLVDIHNVEITMNRVAQVRFELLLPDGTVINANEWRTFREKFSSGDYVQDNPTMLTPPTTIRRVPFLTAVEVPLDGLRLRWSVEGSNEQDDVPILS